jgi:hypothetical protein
MRREKTRFTRFPVNNILFEMQANWEYFSNLLFGFNITIKNPTLFSRLTAIEVILKIYKNSFLEYLKLFKILEQNNKRNFISIIKLSV